MKMLLLLAAAFIVFYVQAQEIKLPEFKWTITDISSKNLSKEYLFENMDIDFIRPQGSICSNRALMWAYDLKRQHKLDTAKIFLFYTKKKSHLSEKTWWYHVAPAVNEQRKLWVLDAGFPGFIDGPLSINEWTNTFVNSKNCKEIRFNETELVERMFWGQVFPHQTTYGWHDCYYIITPHTYWTPETVAKGVLGVNEKGEPIQFERTTIDSEEYYQACVEATTSKMGYFFGGNKKRCRKLADRTSWSTLR